MRPRLAGAATAVGRWSLAHVAVRVEEYFFDYVLYPFMLYKGGHVGLTWLAALTGSPEMPSQAAGYWFGFALLVIASLVLNVVYVRLYDYARTDWFGFEALKRGVARLVPTGSAWRPWRALIRYTTFGYLSVWHSPLFGTLFMRSSSAPYAMTRRDWRVFLVAVAAANLGWTGLVSGAVLIASIVLPLFR